VHEFKPLEMGVQVPRGIHSEEPQKGDIESNRSRQCCQPLDISGVRARFAWKGSRGNRSEITLDRASGWKVISFGIHLSRKAG
jgi:hypothetical protein